MRKLVLLLITLLLISGGALNVFAQDEEATDEEATDTGDAETVVIEATQRGVLFDADSGELLDPLGPGTHEIGVGQTLFIYNMRQQDFTLADDNAVRALTNDGQEVLVDITIIFSIDPEAVNTLHLRWGEVYRDGFVRPTLRAEVRNAIATFNALEVYSSAITQIQTQVEMTMREAMDSEGLVLSSVLIRGVTFSPAFTTAIEERQIAEQLLDRAQLEAERIRVEAQGIAAAAIEAARGDAEIAIIAAEAEAEALSILNDQIAANPLLLYYIYIREMAGNVSVIIAPSGSPFLFDLEMLRDMRLPTLGETGNTEDG